MRRHFIITVICLLVATGVAVLAGRCVRTLPSGRCSELYQRYADAEGVKASFVKGYRVDDSVRVDVTLLEATDSAAWERLKTDFVTSAISQTTYELVSQQKGAKIVYYLPKQHDTRPMNPNILDNDYVTVDLDSRSVFFFHVESQEQILAITRKNIRETHNISSKN